MPASTLSGAAAETTRKTTPHVPRAAFFRLPVGSSLRSDESRVMAHPSVGWLTYGTRLRVFGGQCAV